MKRTQEKIGEGHDLAEYEQMKMINQIWNERVEDVNEVRIAQRNKLISSDSCLNAK